LQACYGWPIKSYQQGRKQMAYRVTVKNNEETVFYLRTTAWTSEITRSNVFDTVDEAKAAARKAMKFMTKTMAKRIVIVPLF
jgi:hypothetical protein